MVGDSVESVPGHPGVPPDKYYNPGSHITLKCIIRNQLIANSFIEVNPSNIENRILLQRYSFGIFSKLKVFRSLKRELVIPGKQIWIIG